MRIKLEFPTAGEYPQGVDHGGRGLSPAPLSLDQYHDHRPSPARWGKGGTLTRSHWLARLGAAILSAGLLIAVTCLGPTAGPAEPPPSGQTGDTQTGGRQSPSAPVDDNRHLHGDGTEPLSPAQRHNIVWSNFEKSKRDSTELAALAKQLCEELDKPDVNPLSLDVTNRIEKIQKLAKKIREEMKGY